jgi:hypothetical protein
VLRSRPSRPSGPEVPLPWERLLWSGRARFPRAPRARYLLTDFRIVRIDGDQVAEIGLHDIAEVHRSQSRLDRLTGTSTLTIHSRGTADVVVLHAVQRGQQLAALLELLSGETRAPLDVDAIDAALSWNPHVTRGGYRESVAGLAIVLIAVFGVAIGLHGKAEALVYSPDDPIYPNGEKRSRAEIEEFMQRDVMPWARVTLGRIKGGPDRITCETCHGGHAEARGWQMPSVAALPLPEVRNRGWERYSDAMDAQMRNAIYGYIAEPEKQARAAYMREVVMPGMARLLQRPAYDFTKPYAYNRSRVAFGCYHCHRVR